MFDPMAINAFYSMGIAPILQQLQTNLGGENAQFTNMAQNVFNTLGKNMPQSEQAAMAGTIPMMGAQQNNVMAALMGAAMSGQGLDVLNQNIGKEATAQEAAYRQLLSNPSLSSLGQAASALPGGVPAQGTVAPTTSATDPLVANNVLPGS
jgi:hypothetical protein